MITSGRLQEGRRRNDAKNDTHSSIKIDTSTLIMRRETLVTCLRRLRSLRTHITEERRLFSSCRYRRSIVSCNCENGSWFFVIFSKLALPKNAIPVIRYDCDFEWDDSVRISDGLKFWDECQSLLRSKIGREVWPEFEATGKWGQNSFVTMACNESVTSVPTAEFKFTSTTKHFCSSRLLREKFLMRKPFEWKRPVIWRPLVFISYLESQQKQVRATYSARTQKLVLIYAWKIVNSGFFESCAHHSDEKDRNLINFNEWDVLCDKKRKQKTFACSISHLTRR